MKTVWLKLLCRLACIGGAAFTLSACTVTGGGYNDPYYHAWYDVYGNYCYTGRPSPGCNFYSDGYKIIASEDPYYNQSYLTFNYWTFYDSYGRYSSYWGYGWQSPNGIIYDEWGIALNEIGDESNTADVIAQAAQKEEQVTKAAGKGLAQKFALNEQKGVVIAKTLQDWAKLGKSRARTASDMADFSKRLYGVEGTKMQSALTQALATQSQKPLEDLNVDVAAYWGTSPENSKKLIKAWYKDEVTKYGIK